VGGWGPGGGGGGGGAPRRPAHAPARPTQRKYMRAGPTAHPPPRARFFLNVYYWLLNMYRFVESERGRAGGAGGMGGRGGRDGRHQCAPVEPKAVNHALGLVHRAL